ncbi:EVE domain-containing protein [Clostridium estertheticum]|uniref:EVE domain-containing protein n=1 Tax=Clostridium estertheticum TaxID=238834 RepID=UPI001C6E3FAE|nr:EVE domain-containing protein [Clostridium estertheticum]MBW9173375.1 EVE domain-containing protein [Clostridium estertheticum]WLC73367.1 EVE domain-containing protein [Clostridium estertheticum]
MNMKLLNDIAKVLVETAQIHKTISYNNLSKRLNNQISPMNLGNPIGELSKMAHELSLPLISVLVINQASTIPGEGYYKLASELKGISEGQAMKEFQQETNDAYQCEEWNKLLDYFNNTSNRKYWIAVHDIVAYNDNPRLLGFNNTIYNAKEIKPGDLIAYYLSGSSTIKGIYEVCEKPWQRYDPWTSNHQIQIKPILELKSSIDFKIMVPSLQLFVNKEKWYSHIQGTNAVRELLKSDFDIIEANVYRACINNREVEYSEILEDDDTIGNESIEMKISRIKRNQEIVCKIKKKYKNKCQIEGCNFTFKKKNGECYSEAHHLELLSKGGSQVESNVVILCPNHHRMVHYADIKIFDLIGFNRNVVINEEDYCIKYI